MLAHLSHVLSAWAILSVAGAGLSTVAQLRPLQEWFARSAIVSIILVLALPLVGQTIDVLINSVSSAGVRLPPELPVHSIVVLFCIGHLALLVWFIRRTLRGTRRNAANAANDIEHARTRRRERLSPDGEDSDP